MHELGLFEICLHMFGLSTKHLLACLDVRRITISHEDIGGFSALSFTIASTVCAPATSLLEDTCTATMLFWLSITTKIYANPPIHFTLINFSSAYHMLEKAMLLVLPCSKQANFFIQEKIDT